MTMNENDKQAEPVAWLCEWEEGWHQYHDAADPLPNEWEDAPKKITPLYAHPAQLVQPNCGACPGDGTVCRKSCRLANESPAQPVQSADAQELRYTADRALAECPCCGSLDVGGVHDTVNCYGCGLTVTAPRPLQNAINKWNQRTNKAPAAERAPLVRLTEQEAKKAYRKGEQAAIARGTESLSHWLGLSEVMTAMEKLNK